MLVGTFIVSLLPFEFLRRGVYNFVALTSFRILSRSFSAAVSFHNVQHRPKSDGICVANHTTPIDVVILQYDQSYALVRARPCSAGMVRERRRTHSSFLFPPHVMTRALLSAAAAVSSRIRLQTLPNSPCDLFSGCSFGLLIKPAFTFSLGA